MIFLVLKLQNKLPFTFTENLTFVQNHKITANHGICQKLRYLRQLSKITASATSVIS